MKQASPTGRLLDLFSPSADDSSTALSTPGQPSSGALAGPRPATERLQQDAAAENDMVHVILQAVENCKPLVKVQSINTGARVIHVPKPVTENEQESMAVRWAWLRGVEGLWQIMRALLRLLMPAFAVRSSMHWRQVETAC